MKYHQDLGSCHCIAWVVSPLYVNLELVMDNSISSESHKSAQNLVWCNYDYHKEPGWSHGWACGETGAGEKPTLVCKPGQLRVGRGSASWSIQTLANFSKLVLKFKHALWCWPMATLMSNHIRICHWIAQTEMLGLEVQHALWWSDLLWILFPVKKYGSQNRHWRTDCYTLGEPEEKEKSTISNCTLWKQIKVLPKGPIIPPPPCT